MKHETVESSIMLFGLIFFAVVLLTIGYSLGTGKNEREVRDLQFQVEETRSRAQRAEVQLSLCRKQKDYCIPEGEKP